VGSALVQAMAAAGTALAAIVAAWALATYTPDTAWRVAMAVGALPLVLMLAVRLGMPESRLWEEYHRRKLAGQLPAEKLNEGNTVIEIMRGASRRYFILGTLMCAGYFFAYQAITTFMPSLMMRALGASPAVVRDVSLLWSAVLAVGMMCTGWISDIYGRKWAVVTATVVGVIGYVAIYAVGDTRYAGTELGWALFWAYALWGAAQGAGGQFGPWMSELYPTEMRATATSTIYTAGRLVGAASPYLVPVFAGIFGGNLLNAMMLGLVGSAVSLICAFALPETAGRAFAVVEGREHEESTPDALHEAAGRR
jgi:SHS family lactate transporter-like MFS transporter